jgi:uncharacterized repeat protein (TIGR01451 family)
MAGCRVTPKGKRSADLVGLALLVVAVVLTVGGLVLGQPPAIYQSPEPPLADGPSGAMADAPSAPDAPAPLQPALHREPLQPADHSDVQPTQYPARPYGLPGGVPAVRPVPAPASVPVPVPAPKSTVPATSTPTPQTIPNVPPDLLPPQVTITVKVPSVVAIGQEMEYRLIVQNHSRTAAAHHVFVRDWVPADVELIRAVPEPDPPRPGMEKERIWSLKSIEPGGKREIVLTVRPTKLGDLRNCARVQCEHGQCVVTQVTQPQVSVKIRGPREAIIHEPLLLAVDVTNPTKVPAHEVAVTLALPPGYEFTDAAPGRVGQTARYADVADVAAALATLHAQTRQQVPPPPSLPGLSPPLRVASQPAPASDPFTGGQPRAWAAGHITRHTRHTRHARRTPPTRHARHAPAHRPANCHRPRKSARSARSRRAALRRSSGTRSRGRWARAWSRLACRPAAVCGNRPSGLCGSPSRR